MDCAMAIADILKSSILITRRRKPLSRFNRRRRIALAPGCESSYPEILLTKLGRAE
jgi:hypothetical protein